MSRISRVKLGEDAKFELSLAATARERRNRPMVLVFGAAALLIVSGLLAIYGVATRASARSELRIRQEDQSRAEALVGEWKRLVQAETASPVASGIQKPFKISSMEDLAVRARMKNKPTPPSTREDKSRPGLIITRYTYPDVRDPNLDALVEWVRIATEEMQGLDVESITLKPEPAAGWKMDVTFRRWERAGS